MQNHGWRVVPTMLKRFLGESYTTLRRTSLACYSWDSRRLHGKLNHRVKYDRCLCYNNAETDERNLLATLSSPGLHRRYPGPPEHPQVERAWLMSPPPDGRAPSKYSWSQLAALMLGLGLAMCEVCKGKGCLCEEMAGQKDAGQKSQPRSEERRVVISSAQWWK